MNEAYNRQCWNGVNVKHVVNVRGPAHAKCHQYIIRFSTSGNSFLFFIRIFRRSWFGDGSDTPGSN